MTEEPAPVEAYPRPAYPATQDHEPPTEPEHRSRRSLLGGLLVEGAEIIVFAVVIFLLVRVIVQNFVVEGPSMQPTLLANELLIVNKQAYTSWSFGDVPVIGGAGPISFGQPQRGDIVVLHGPNLSNRDLIKRVVALPGETVEVRTGQVLIDGSPLVEPYVRTSASYSTSPVSIPADQVYVLGDNRGNSSDSHIFGPIPVADLVGKAVFVYWPLEEFGLAPNFSAYGLPAGQPLLAD